MKRRLPLLLITLALCAALIAGCSAPSAQSAAPSADNAQSAAPQEQTQADVPVRLGALKGATSMGLVKLLDDAQNGRTEGQYEFTMAAAADELTPKLLKGELDVLAVPVNLGSVLYNNSEGKVQLLAINTLGLVYIVEKGGDTVSSLSDLKGKTLYATGKGTTPEYALRYLLTRSGLDPDKDVTIEWKSEPTEVVAAMAQEAQAVAMMPQPFVTVAQSQLEDLHVALDLTKEWDALDNGSQLLTAGLIVRAAFAREHPDAVALFLKEYADSTKYLNDQSAEAAKLVEQFDIVKAPIAEKAIPYCNIVCITGQEMADSAKGYLEILFEQNPKAVGGALPEDDFYYVGP